MSSPKSRSCQKRGFTLIELLIAVAILAVLAAIAIPSYLEAQTRTRVARAQREMRVLATAIEGYRIDHDAYPAATSNPTEMAPATAAYLGGLAPGLHTFQTAGAAGEIAGLQFATLTTPVAYLSALPLDAFAANDDHSVTPYAYWVAPQTGAAWILTSIGPDRDVYAPDGRGNGAASNPISTAAQSGSPAALGDINEVAVMDIYDGVGPYPQGERGRLGSHIKELTYDPTNGTLSDGDIYRTSGF